MARRLAIDANLLVLLAVGQVSRLWIGKHRRLRSYSEADFDLLASVLRGFDRVLLTPNVSTETSNLIGYGVEEPLRSQFMAALGLILRGSDESYRPSAEVSLTGEFMRLGLTDATWMIALDEQSVLLTDDGDLYRAAVHKGAKAFQFSEVRRLGRL